MSVTLSEVRNLLASLNGEDSAPANVSRDRFINAIGKDIWYRMNWPFRRIQTNINVSVSSYVLASDFSPDGLLDLREVVSGVDNDHIYTVVSEFSADQYAPGDYVCWFSGNEADGYTLYISETNSPTLRLTYDAKWTDLVNAPDTTKIPFAMPVAAGAYSLLKVYDDPEYNNTREDKRYEYEIGKMRAYYNRNVSNRLVSANEAADTYLGDVSY